MCCAHAIPPTWNVHPPVFCLWNHYFHFNKQLKCHLAQSSCLWRLLRQRGPGLGMHSAVGAGHMHVLPGMILRTNSNADVTSSVEFFPTVPRQSDLGLPQLFVHFHLQHFTHCTLVPFLGHSPLIYPACLTENELGTAPISLAFVLSTNCHSWLRLKEGSESGESC